MSEHLPTNSENLDDRLQDVLEQGGQSARDLLNLVDLDNPDELREAIQLCERHLVGKQPTAMYVVSATGVASNLENMQSLSVGDIEKVGYDKDGSVYFIRKALE
ncbi:hypothetical protein NG701_07640 [Pseudarthrobacter sp. HLT3-5]|uniref:hypothetical protein n=1 Tax=Pseudarthrobacter cellobiosi TaxID=2953654 RepID=UPI00208E689A|nr:hypothetical protein [Pseudarthrobacter sp. HLT3-5]MCO4274301.1 hypothetical protein [Pseudarthrobacter sp. HLT3-5]